MADFGDLKTFTHHARDVPEEAVPVKLVVVAGPDEGLEMLLDAAIKVGSHEDNDLVLQDQAVSRDHATFTRIGGLTVVTDRGSRNGTFLGESKIHEVEVPIGAILSLGESRIAVYPRWYVRAVVPSQARSFGELLGDSVAMREIFAILERVSGTELTVLVEGESGTGKELVGRSVHSASARSKARYVVFDCGSVPTELAESELFGHKKGAFSGAVADRAGAFQRADGGTIFLDEIGELPLALQPKLLRVLETGEIRSVGDDKMRKVDVRVLAATNRTLSAEVRRGRFRQDLLYRLEVVRIRMPPLRERPDDIPSLLRSFLSDRLPEGDQVEGENLRKLMNYSWPGNVREMRNVLQRSVALAQTPGGKLASFEQLVFNLGPAAATKPEGLVGFPGVVTPQPYKDAKEELLMDFDRAYVKALMQRHGSSVTEAAAAAELSRKHLYQLMKKVAD